MGQQLIKSGTIAGDDEFVVAGPASRGDISISIIKGGAFNMDLSIQWAPPETPTVFKTRAIFYRSGVSRMAATIVYMPQAITADRSISG